MSRKSQILKFTHIYICMKLCVCVAVTYIHILRKNGSVYLLVVSPLWEWNKMIFLFVFCYIFFIYYS